MPRLRSFVKYWVPVAVWMVVIYSASSDTKSFEHSSRILAPILQWLMPQLSEEVVSHVVFIIRKFAHLTEYAILALLLWRALRKPVRNDTRPWSWIQAGLAILVVALYAGSDEIHQLFVPHREGKIADVMIDTSGGVAGILLLWAAGRLRKWW
jgi:VanZ family protein